MRDIKFRAIKVDGGAWVFGDLNQHPVHYDCQIIENGVINHSVIRETVGQYTGLNDKNGNPIYEGDIMSDEERVVTFKIIYDDYGLVMQYAGNNIPVINNILRHMEVTGNIHQNPELLQSQSIK